MAHHHFTRSDRVLLVKLKTAGLNNTSCARILGFHPSTVGRELKRGAAATTTGYSVRVARERTQTLRTIANQQHRKLNQLEAERIVALIRQYYSPDQAGQAIGLSHSTVYRWLWSQGKAFLASVWQYLRHPKLRRKYGTKRLEKQRELAKKRWIDARPQTANDRVFYGNFRREAERLLTPLPRHLKRSLTLDNGREMNDYEELERHTNTPIYFAHPYRSWERGGNENFNGLLRQFFPKGSDFSTITDKQIDLAVNLLNTRPRKRHGYRCPEQLLKPYLGIAI